MKREGERQSGRIDGSTTKNRRQGQRLKEDSKKKKKKKKKIKQKNQNNLPAQDWPYNTAPAKTRRKARPWGGRKTEKPRESEE